MRARSFWKANLSALTLLILFQRERAMVPDSFSDPSVSLEILRKEKLLADDLPKEITTCGGVGRAITGILQTPDFPSPFPVPFRCNWVIDASSFPGASIVVYLTQIISEANRAVEVRILVLIYLLQHATDSSPGVNVFISKGLRFESFAYLDVKGALSSRRTEADSKNYDSSYSSFDRKLVFDSDSRALKEVSWIRFNSPYLLATLALDRLEGSHIRDLGQLLTVYGLNMTYEVISKSQSVRKRRCSLLECSMAGHCYAKKDFRSFYCSCFEGYFGSHCEFSRFCDPSKNLTLCLNGGTCGHVGSTAFHCFCKEGFYGALCQYKDIKSSSNLSKVSKCKRNDCNRLCPFDGESACNCSSGVNAATIKSRYTVTIKLTNVSILKNNPISSLKAVFQEQFQIFIKHQKAPEVNEMKFKSVSKNGEVSLEFIADQKRVEELREAFNSSEGSLGNLTLISEQPMYQFENRLLLKDVVVDETEVPIGGEFTASCVAQGSPSMEFTWYKDGVWIDHTLAIRYMWQRLLGKDTKGSYTALLRITRAAAEDDGDLWCHVKDAGIHQWKATRVKVVKPNHVIVTPRTVSLMKGENSTIVCISSNEEGLNPDNLEFFWMKNDSHLISHDSDEIVENLYPSGSILHIYNALASATYVCHVIIRIGSSVSHQRSFVASVHVAEPDSTSFCPPEYTWGVYWPRIASGQQAFTECPLNHQRKTPLHSMFLAFDSMLTPNESIAKLIDQSDYNKQWKEWNASEGEAKRICKQVDGKAEWDEVPDFSGCQWAPLITIYNQFRRLTLGYKATNVLETLKQLSNFLASSIPFSKENMQRLHSFNLTESPPLYPGQWESVVLLLADVQEYLCLKAEVERNCSEWRSISINMLDIAAKLLTMESTVKNSQRILQLISLTTKQSFLWINKLNDHNVASFHYPEINVSHKRDISETNNNETSGNSKNQYMARTNPMHLQDGTSIMVYSEPVSWNHMNNSNFVSNLYYPRDEQSHPKWFSDKVRCQFFLTTKRKLEKYKKEFQQPNQSDAYEVYEKTAEFDEQNFGSNESIPSSLPSVGINSSASWTLIAFQKLGSILSLNYTAKTRYGYDLEHRLSSNIIFTDVTRKDHLDKTSYISIPSGEESFRQMFNSSFDLTIEFFLSINSLPDLTLSMERKGSTWNVTCAQLLLKAFHNNSEVSTTFTTGNHWKLDSCKTIPSLAIKDRIIGETLIKSSAKIKSSEFKEVKDTSSVMCQCKQPGAYAVLVLLKKMKEPDFSHEDTPVDGEGKWILTLDYFGVLEIHRITCFSCSFCLILTGVSLILLLCQLQLPTLLCITNIRKKHQVHDSSCTNRLNLLPYVKKCFSYNTKFWIHLFKIQFCITVILAMTLLILALQSSSNQKLLPCTKIFLVVLLMVAMSSQLGKVLIIYAEVMTACCIASLTSVAGGVNFAGNGISDISVIDSRKISIDVPRLKTKANAFLQKMNPSIWGIVTGIPMLIALLANLSNETTTLESWWLINGSLLFKAFITSSAVISLAFASFLTCLLRKLISLRSLTEAFLSVEDGLFENSDQIQPELPQNCLQLIQERIELLKRSALIFTSLISVILWSIASGNAGVVLFTWYIFSLSCILLGLVIFFCYVVKSDIPPQISRIFKALKGNFSSKNADIGTRCNHKENESSDSFDILISWMQLHSRSKDERKPERCSRASTKRKERNEHINSFYVPYKTVKKEVATWFRNKTEVSEGSAERSGTSRGEATIS